MFVYNSVVETGWVFCIPLIHHLIVFISLFSSCSIHSCYFPANLRSLLLFLPPFVFAAQTEPEKSQRCWVKVTLKSTANTAVIACCPLKPTRVGLSGGRRRGEGVRAAEEWHREERGSRAARYDSHTAKRPCSRGSGAKTWAYRRMAGKHIEKELMSGGQTAPAKLSHRGRPVTELYAVASWSAGQTGERLSRRWFPHQWTHPAEHEHPSHRRHAAKNLHM